jgi:hypothetical protein
MQLNFPEIIKKEVWKGQTGIENPSAGNQILLVANLKLDSTVIATC